MRFLLLTGTALIALAGSPATAQESTGDPVIDRLNALEARVKQLEARNAQLEQRAAATQTRVEAAEKRDTALRRARIGLEGTAMKVFNYRIEVDFAGNQVGLTDAWLQYAGIEDLLITAGQHGTNSPLDPVGTRTAGDALGTRLHVDF